MRNQFKNNDIMFDGIGINPIEPINYFGFNIGEWNCIIILLGYIVVITAMGFVMLKLLKTRLGT